MTGATEGAGRAGARYASPVDYERYGHYGQGRGFDTGSSRPPRLGPWPASRISRLSGI
jgi:hypothetical protein